MYYKNISNSVKTFYGVEFKPGSVKEVPGFITDRHMIVTDMLKEPAKQKPSSNEISKQDKPADKKVSTKQSEPVKEPEKENNEIETN